VDTAIAGSQWQRVEDPLSGRVYFYHQKSKETRWVKPNSGDAVSAFLKDQGITETDDFEL
jgi:hypothetical protein